MRTSSRMREQHYNKAGPENPGERTQCGWESLAVQTKQECRMEVNEVKGGFLGQRREKRVSLQAAGSSEGSAEGAGERRAS